MAPAADTEIRPDAAPGVAPLRAVKGQRSCTPGSPPPSA
jgi:hypothetical protein